LFRRGRSFRTIFRRARRPGSDRIGYPPIERGYLLIEALGVARNLTYVLWRDMGVEPSRKPVGLLLFDRDVLFRESLATLLGAEPGFRVIGQCADSRELETLAACLPDVVLLAWDNRTHAGYEVLSAIRNLSPQSAVLILGGMEPREAMQALRLGASGIFREDDPEKLIAAVHIVAEGGAWLQRGLLRLLAAEISGESAPFDLLTERERMVLHAVLEGKTTRRIGESVGASESAVKRTLRSLFEKTGTHSRAALVRVALQASFRMRT
jgi:DNA-binding NarL/FixJ family response regulator